MRLEGIGRPEAQGNHRSAESAPISTEQFTDDELAVIIAGGPAWADGSPVTAEQITDDELAAIVAGYHPRRLAAVDTLMRHRARKKMLNFTQYTFPSYRANRHHQVLAAYLDEFIAGRIKRLLVLMPPQHGKSELATRRLSAKLLGNDPEKRLLVCAHSSDLATSMNRDVQQIIDSPAYQLLFRDTRLARPACRAGLESGSRPGRRHRRPPHA